jgi:5-formyltetrahydrofolate cyclo-ligase
VLENIVMSLEDEKKKLRQEARARRKAAAAEADPDAARRLADTFFVARIVMGVHGTGVVSGYWPMAEEMDVRPLLERLHAEGYTCALPVVPGKGVPLIFRRWRPGDALGQAGFNLSEPGPEAPEVRPDVVLAPLLAFDAEGYRIGWGGGYYDRTLAKLRAEGRVLAIGVAFNGQQVPRVPRDDRDQRLDWIVTDRRAFKCGEAP